MPRTQITAEPGVPQIVITREFTAPRDLVFRAHVDPELLVQWLGPRELKMTVDRYEVRDGGRWRYIHADADGNEYGFHGVFHGTPSPDGVVQTFEFEGVPGHVSLDTWTFNERGGTHAGALGVQLPVGRGSGRDGGLGHGTRGARLGRATGRAAGPAGQVTGGDGMGRLIVSAQMTADAVMDHIEGWFNPRLEDEAYGLGGQDGPARRRPRWTRSTPPTRSCSAA